MIKNLLVIAIGMALAVLTGCGPSAGPEHGYRTTSNPPRRNADLARKLNAEALEQIQDGKLDKAEERLKKALDADVTFGPAHNNLGKVYYHQGKLYLAAWEFQYATKLMPDQPEPRNNLGLVLEAAGKLSEAVAQYEQARSLGPDNPQFIGNLARAKLRRGDGDPQVRQLLEEIVFKDTRPEWVDWAKQELAVSAHQPAGAEPVPEK